MTYHKLTRDELAQRIASDIFDGAYVNLGIGMPTLVASHLPTDREIILHSENGILGMGPASPAGEEDYTLVNAGKEPVTLVKGGSFFDHADSFLMVRGGHLDICVLGAFQVSTTGDLANWSTGVDEAVPAVGGAMDLAVGARETWVMMDLFARDGRAKVVSECTYPLTGRRCVTRIYTDHGSFTCGEEGLILIEAVDGMSPDELERLIGLRLQRPSEVS
jgi:3-oxoadipate CoA-transferase beta subunit